MKIKTAAKINLALDVVGVLENGYHALESVFQTVGLYDEVTVEPADTITVDCILPEEFASADPIPCDERNIAFKAAKLFLETTGVSGGCRISIRKGIPSQAGMGGGSTDAAAVIYCLSELTGIKLPREELAAMGKKLGADVPFFFTGGTAFVEGIGEKITPLPDFSDRLLVIAKGTQGVSTAEAYRSIDALTAPIHPHTRALADSVKNAPDEVCRYVGNLFEQAVKLDEVDSIKSVMLSCGAEAACMTGSGSAVFAMFTDEKNAADCAAKLSASGFFAVTCKTVSRSFI